ncbi:MAG: SpoIIE family protein phosphatase, partial [Methylococcales bacterium]|nr:SpoIIE family protein phosphatase [Methylococcales bacterium]
MKDMLRSIATYMLDQYGTVLFILAITITFSYLVVMYDLKNQEGNATLIRVSSEQGQIIQGINFHTTQLARYQDKKSASESRRFISKNLARLQDTHLSLKVGDRFVREGSRITHVRGVLPPEFRKIYFDKGENSLNRQMYKYRSAVREILGSPIEDLKAKSSKLQLLYYEITPALITNLNTVSSLYQKRMTSMLEGTKRKQNFIIILSLGILALLGTGLLRPLVDRLKESNLKVETEKAFADNVINTAQALIIGLDTSANIILFNQYAEESTGWAKEEVLGRHFFETFLSTDNKRLQSLFSQMMSGDVAFSDEIETRVDVSTGDVIDVIWHSTVIFEGKAKAPVMFLVTGSDITERKQAEEELRRTHAKMEILSQRLQDEVNLAATLQQSILPNATVELPGIQGFANLLTSSEVGGDYYDYYKIGGYQSVILMGDVSGHGVAAGTMVSAAKAGIYPLIHEGITNPSKLLNLLNETLLMTAQQSLLMTMNCLSLDARTGKLQFANAGHVLPYLWRHKGQYWEMLEASGLPLGKSIDSDYSLSAIEITMEVSDRLFLFTDGLVEEESSSGEAFGYERLEDILSQCGKLDAEVVKSYLMSALKIHCATEKFDDDVSMMIITHSDRISQEAMGNDNDISDIIRISERFYRQGDHPIPRISRKYVVFLAEQPFSGLLERLSQDGICRVLPKHSDFCKVIGWNHLLSQHHETPDDDLYELMPHLPKHRQFQLTHTEDKLFIMEEILSWLADMKIVSQEHLDGVMVILDEMLENSFYAAPRNGKG